MNDRIIKLFSINIAMLFILFRAATVSAVTIDVGPVYTPPGVGSESVSGDADVAGGMTISYASMDLSQTENLYFGIRQDLYQNGFSSNGAGLSGSEIFSFSSTGSNTIVYTGSTSIQTLTQGLTVQPTRMTLTFTGTGSIVQDATTSSFNGPNGDVEAMWHALSNFTVNILMEAQVVEVTDSNYLGWEPARDLYNRLPCPLTGCRGTGSSVDWGFYYEETTAVPIPAALWLFSSGVLGLVGIARRRKSA